MYFPRSFIALVAMTATSIASPQPGLQAQDPDARPAVAASGRVTTSVSFDGRLMGGGTSWLNRSTSHSGPARLTLDYGQPHARGRDIFGGLVPYGEVWRLGANLATHLTAEVDIRIGDLDITRGVYTLYLIPREDGAELVVNRQTRQWGTDYDSSLDLGRLPLRKRVLPDVVQSLDLTLEPIFPQPEEELPSGELRIVWGRVEYSADWMVTWMGGP